jgi:cobalt/nickel transport system ATP-binding protein
MSEPILLLEGVCVAYEPTRPVLAGCDLRLEAGERVGLIGANGSGKTTLLALLVGLIRPSAGRVEVFGKVRTSERDFREIRGRAGLLFQDPDDQLFCPTVAEDVAFGPLNLGVGRDEVRRIVAQTLDSLGLAGFEDRITYKLSGGEKRLVAVATVLAMQPDLLLLDEPTSGLDDEARARVIDVLAALPQAMLVVSHDRPLLDRLATRVLRLANGHIEPAG